jgi:2-succinyl-6-hydroxy-2,4-cyclohexadiene-1-carboxylate synthase
MNLDIRGVDYHLITDGDLATEPVIVLLHGFSGSSADWADLIPRFRAMDRATVAIDLIGHGRSETSEDPARYTMTETVRDLDSILAALGIESADWVGYSMGGRVALHLALAHPGRVRSLVLESASAGIEDPGSRERRHHSDDALAARIEERGIEWFADYWGMLPLFETQWELPAETLRALRARRLSNNPGGLAHSLRGMGQGAHDYVGGRLPSLGRDTLFLAGERDPKYVEVARRASAAVPGASCVIVPGVGHTVHLEAPDAFARALASHWNAVLETSVLHEERHP